MWDMDPEARKQLHKEDLKKYFLMIGVFLFLIMILTIVINVPLNEEFNMSTKITLIVLSSIMLVAVAIVLVVKISVFNHYKIIDRKRFEAGFVIMSKNEKFSTWELYVSSLNGIKFNEIILPQSKKHFDLSVKNYISLNNNFSRIYNETIKGKILDKVTNNKKFKTSNLTNAEIEKAIDRSREIMLIKGDNIRISFAIDKLSKSYVTEYKFNIKNADKGSSFESKY